MDPRNFLRIKVLNLPIMFKNFIKESKRFHVQEIWICLHCSFFQYLLCVFMYRRVYVWSSCVSFIVVIVKWAPLMSYLSLLGQTLIKYLLNKKKPPENTVVNLCMTFDEHDSWKPHVKRLWKESIGNLWLLQSITRMHA